ncbi:MAG: wax ester/triacylglycerol synthase family O-acyltransferase [Candidatus Binatia bacterium]|nr:wax ester/triacylglycerol synthase family O-acyltransferase [Candidatus Binatia bacterium]
MPRYAYERLSAQDQSFLAFETRNVHMHVAATQIYDAGDLATGQGGIDFQKYKRATEAILHLVPRYRQKLKWIPIENRAVWVDDRHFNLDYHIRHTSLPRPGEMDQLARLSQRIMSQPLDRGRPLWEIWVVEGMQDNRFAVITKIHHCMIDGASGVDLSMILMSPTPDRQVDEPVPYIPRPVPSTYELLRDEMLDRVKAPLELIRGVRRFATETEDLRTEVGIRLRALQELAGWAMRGASETPINGPVGPHRRFDWMTMPLNDIKAVRRALGCTVNDIVLATVSGAVRNYLLRRRVDPAELDFRTSAPVSVRKDEDKGKMGNNVSSWIIRLPIGEPDPIRRIEAIHETTQELKRSKQALGVEMMMAAAEWAPSSLLSLGAQAASGPINMIVTNVPGPQFPLYMLGAKLEAMFPVVPLLDNMGLGVALMSYDGKVCWGFNADYEMIPDLSSFVRLIGESFAEIQNGVRLRDVKAPDANAPVAAGGSTPDAKGATTSG